MFFRAGSCRQLMTFRGIADQSRLLDCISAKHRQGLLMPVWDHPMTLQGSDLSCCSLFCHGLGYRAGRLIRAHVLVVSAAADVPAFQAVLPVQLGGKPPAHLPLRRSCRHNPVKKITAGSDGIDRPQAVQHSTGAHQCPAHGQPRAQHTQRWRVARSARQQLAMPARLVT